MKTKLSKTSSLRIIGGQWRGRKLPILNAPGLRPTGSRVRETLFNWLVADIQGSCCLDLFAGTGALAFEALSRGAKEAHMVELHSPAAKQIRENLKLLEANSGHIHATKALDWLKHNAEGFKGHFDLVFLDPPFADQLWQETLEALAQSLVLKADALIYIERPKKLATDSSGLKTVKEKSSGDVCYGLYQFQ